MEMMEMLKPIHFIYMNNHNPVFNVKNSTDIHENRKYETNGQILVEDGERKLEKVIKGLFLGKICPGKHEPVPEGKRLFWIKINDWDWSGNALEVFNKLSGLWLDVKNIV